MPGIGVGVSPCLLNSPAFSPLHVGTSFAWLRSDTVVESGGTVTTWTDKTGNGRSPTQATGTKRPAYTAAALNGHPSLDFDGTDDFLRWAGTMEQVLHCFAVVLPVNDATFDAGATTLIDGATGNSGRIYVPSATQINLTSDGANELILGGPTQTFDAEDWCVLEWVLNGASSTFTINAETPGTGNAGAGNPGGICLGIFGDQASAASASRWVELIVYSAELSAGESAQVRSYITNRYGLAT